MLLAVRCSRLGQSLNENEISRFSFSFTFPLTFCRLIKSELRFEEFEEELHFEPLEGTENFKHKRFLHIFELDVLKTSTGECINFYFSMTLIYFSFFFFESTDDDVMIGNPSLCVPYDE